MSTSGKQSPKAHIEKYAPDIHVLCSSRDAPPVEAAPMGAQARELVLHHLLEPTPIA